MALRSLSKCSMSANEKMKTMKRKMISLLIGLSMFLLMMGMQLIQ